MNHCPTANTIATVYQTRQKVESELLACGRSANASGELLDAMARIGSARDHYGEFLRLANDDPMVAGLLFLHGFNALLRARSLDYCDGIIEKTAPLN
jgi:hypothetical protein